jgi:hypothetical protein
VEREFNNSRCSVLLLLKLLRATESKNRKAAMGEGRLVGRFSLKKLAMAGPARIHEYRNDTIDALHHCPSCFVSSSFIQVESTSKTYKLILYSIYMRDISHICANKSKNSSCYRHCHMCSTCCGRSCFCSDCRPCRLRCNGRTR